MWIYLPVQEVVDDVKLADFEVKSGRDSHGGSEGSGSKRDGIGAFEIRFLKVSPGVYFGLILDQMPYLVEFIREYPL